MDVSRSSVTIMADKVRRDFTLEKPWSVGHLGYAYLISWSATSNFDNNILIDVTVASDFR
jgi:hypothetical protein